MIVDMHSHILPGADHGSDSTDTSVAMVKRAVEAGVTAIHLSSHFYHHSDTVEDFLERRKHSYDKLMAALDEETKSKVTFVLGAEVTLEVDLKDEPRLKELCIGETNNILIEMPNMKWTDWTFNALYDISARHNVKPLIAHVDRYDEKQCKKLYEYGYNCQLNASSFAGLISRHKSMKLLHEGNAHVIGSDVHGKEAKEYDNYEKALKCISAFKEELMEFSAKLLGL